MKGHSIFAAGAGLLLSAAFMLGCSSNNNGNNNSSNTSGGGAKAPSGGTPSVASACPAGTGTSGSGVSLKLGSKDFAEEEILANITKLVLEKHGFKVDYTTKAADPAIDNAIRSGSIDMLWQYTGTELQQILNVDNVPTDLDQAFKMAQQLDAAKGLCWVAPAPLDDTNALAIKASDKAKYGSNLSEFGAYLKAHPDTSVCIQSEFRTRADGLPGLQKVYGSYNGTGFKDIGPTAETAIANGDCVAGEVYSTDSAIAANNLYVLVDDKKLFPPDNVGLIVRADVLKKNPAIANLMTPVAAKLTSDVITQLNKQVEVDKMNVVDVSRAWLQKNNLL